MRSRWNRCMMWSVSLILLSQSAWLQAGNWPAWRGPLNNGVSDETGLPTEWSTTKNVAWKVPLPGPAGATPVIWEKHIFLTSVDGNELVLLAFNTEGKQLWRRVVGEGNKNVRGDEGNSASPSPVTDGKHVWATMANGQVACFDFAGQEIWKLNLQDRYGKFRIAFGMSSTPVLHADQLMFQLIHGDGKAATQEALVVSLHKDTGKEQWQSKRVTGAYNENEHSYASPILFPHSRVPYLITHGADFTIAYNVTDGSERWRLGGLNPHDDPKRRYHPTLRFVASPSFSTDLIVIPTAKNGPVFAIRPDGKGDLTGDTESGRWMLDSNTPDVPSPVLHDGLVYLCRENGNLMCLDAKSGSEIYNERTHRTRHRASPLCADGKLYLTARDGKITVVQTGKDFKILSQNDLGEQISASPAVSNGTIYLRTFDHLWAIQASK